MSRDLPTPTHFATEAQWDAVADFLRSLIEAGEEQHNGENDA